VFNGGENGLVPYGDYVIVARGDDQGAMVMPDNIVFAGTCDINQKDKTKSLNIKWSGNANLNVTCEYYSPDNIVRSERAWKSVVTIDYDLQPSKRSPYKQDN
jgi:hypothetical protein